MLFLIGNAWGEDPGWLDNIMGGGFNNRGGPNDGFNQHRGGGGGGYDNGGSRGFGGGRGGGDHGGII